MKSIANVWISILFSDLDSLMSKLAISFRSSDVVKIRSELPMNIFCFWRPHHIREIYSNRVTSTVKPPHNMMKREEWLMGKNMVTSTGDDWKYRREMYGHLFRPSSLGSVSQAIPTVVDRMLKRIANKHEEPVDIFSEARQLSLDTAFQMFTSTALENHLEQVSNAVDFAEESFPLQIPPFSIPTRGNLKFRREGKYLRRLIREIVEYRRLTNSGEDDLLSYLLLNRDPSLGRPWSNDEIVDELFAAVFGTSAVASTIGRGLCLLAQHPHAVECLNADLGKASDGNISVEALNAIPYLDNVFKEIIRLYPPFWGSVRYAASPLEVDGHHIPEGSTLLPIRFFSQRHPDYWSAPLAFNPERFKMTSQAGSDGLQRNSVANLLPFGAGPRTCLGVHLAPLICKFALAQTIRRFNFQLCSSDLNPEIGVRFSYGLFPAGKALITFSPKKAATF